MDNFYAKSIDRALRFGDVLKGYVYVTPNIKEPNFNIIDEYFKESVAILVILT